MTFDEVLDQVRALLQQRGRVTYRSLKLRYQLDDEVLAGVTDELINAERVAVDEDDKVLIWLGNNSPESSVQRPASKHIQGPKPVLSPSTLLRINSVEGSKVQGQETQPLTPDTQHPAAERRQLTVQFIDLVGSTNLSQQLDPEDYHARVVAYQDACQRVIARYGGHIAQYLGDGVLAYFGYPAAHEDDAVRAVRSGLEIVAAVSQLECTPPLHVRIGIHTGPVVVGEIGAGERTERLALGETPNIAARVQGVAEPDTVVISTVTHRLVQGLFECQDLGLQTLKGISTPLSLYRVIGESAMQSRFEVAVQAGLTPLVGRDLELNLLQERWAQAQDGEGQVVLLSGEAGIGKSRLIQELKDRVVQDGAVRIEFRCSSYHQKSTFYPLIEHLQRLLHFAAGDTSQDKVRKLEQTLASYHFPQTDTVPLLAALLSLPQPEGLPSLSLTPQQRKQKTLDVLIRWLLEEAEKAPVYTVWEDVHWADPSTLEFLELCLDHTPTARTLMVLTFRPEFTPPWASRSYLSHLALSRLERAQSSVIVEGVTGGKALPAEVLQQVVAKTDGVPLFVEELTKMVMESGLLREVDGHYELTGPLPPLAIPSTLQDSLMARLDRLAPVREVAQLGAAIGRDFSYELLAAIAPFDEITLQQGLTQLMNAELLYQRGLPPRAQYSFKHALVQDTAYQSLLKSRRQQLHQQVAQVLAERFPETVETQPELVARHYTEAGLKEQALPYWQRAGQSALERSANVEAISHLTTGLELLKTLPGTPARLQHELMLQVTLSAPLMATKGWAAPEVEQVSARARELCQQVGESSQLFPVLWGLWNFYIVRAQLQTAHELGEQFMRLSQTTQDPVFLLQAHFILGDTFFWGGEFTSARAYLEQDSALDTPQGRRSHAFLYGLDPGIACLSHAAWTLWLLGYPDQALKRTHQALALAQELSHPLSLAWALFCAAVLHQYRREWQATQERADALITLSTEQGFPHWVALGTLLRSWAVIREEEKMEELVPMRQGLATWQAMGAALNRPYCLALLAEACGSVARGEEGLAVLDEALAAVHETGERFYEAELYRLKGELVLQSGVRGPASHEENQKAKVKGQKSKVPNPRSQISDPQGEAESCFLKAIEITRKQSAKLLELRAVMSLCRLWQQQALELGAGSAEQGAQSREQKAERGELGLCHTLYEVRSQLHEAYRMLSEVYNWFTEGFDTADLKDAKVLLEKLS